MSIEVQINGKKELIEQKSLAELLEYKNIKPEVVTVEINNEITPRAMYDKYIIKQGDKIEFVYFMGGGI